MLSFYAAKGGVGCSVVAATASLLVSRDEPTLLVDLVGDQPAILGIEADGPGLASWSSADTALPDALRRLEVAVDDRLSLLPLGVAPQGALEAPGPRSPLAGPTSHVATAQLDTLARLLQLEGRRVVVDVGTRATVAHAMLGASSAAVLVTRACYLAVRAARTLVPPDHVVLIEEPGRALRTADVAHAFGVSVDVVMAWDPAVARLVDAGLLAGRLPRSLLALRAVL